MIAKDTRRESAKPEIKKLCDGLCAAAICKSESKNRAGTSNTGNTGFHNRECDCGIRSRKLFTQRALKTAEAEEFFNAESTQDSRTRLSIAESARKHQKQKNFSTQRALKTAEAEDFSTQRALKTSEAEEFFNAESAQNIRRFSTQRALRALETENFSTQKALKISRTENFAASGRDSLKSQNGELGSFVASMDTEDVPMKGKAEENDGYMSADRQLSEQDIRMNAVAEMKKGNNEQAFQYYAILAEKEDWEFMYHDTTELFESEQNILRRSQDAVFWFTKCAEFCQDSWTVSLAEFQLGEMYAKGIGVKKNYKIAEKYYRSSAEKGNPYAKKKFVAGRYVK